MITPAPADRLLAGPPISSEPESFDAHRARLGPLPSAHELIDVDEWRYPILAPRTVPPGLLHDAQRAVDCCPMRALILEKVPAPVPPDRTDLARR